MRRIILLLCLAAITASAKAQLLGAGFDDGYYYDNTGAKVEGRIHSESSFIIYKHPKSPAQKKILATDTKGYVIGKDSFIVSRTAGFKNPVFLRVVLNNPTKIYFFKADDKVSFEPAPKGSAANFVTGTGKGSTKHYFYGPNPDDLSLLTAQNFISVMSDIMSDKPAIVERVTDKTIHIKNIEEWVLFYIQEKAAYPPQAQ